jgi:hypothetical protein
VVSNSVAVNAPLKAIVPVVFVKETVPALTAPLKLVLPEFVMVRLPLPPKVEPRIVPAVPPFSVKPFALLVIAPIVIRLPAGRLPAVVVTVEAPAKVTLPKSIAAPFVATLPLMVVALAMDVTPFAKVVVPVKLTPPVLEKVAAFVIVPPAFNATL